jgi:hypothetical protein
MLDPGIIDIEFFIMPAFIESIFDALKNQLLSISSKSRSEKNPPPFIIKKAFRLNF